MDKKSYKKRRANIDKFFEESNLIKDSVEEHISPSKKYRLIIQEYKTGEGTWSYTRGIVKSIESDRIVADIKRNYSHFWHAWCDHDNGNEYLLCGEDYQGQTIVNLTEKKITNYFPDEGHKGWGFCWVNAYPSLDSKLLAVDGCYWACPYEIVLFDFTNPDKLPYKEFHRSKGILEVEGWSPNNKFVFSREIEVRSSDGIPYDSLSEEEQNQIDDGKVESKEIIQQIKIDAQKYV
ncbi:hypothetical protein [Aliikangiella sp. IMCC44359]|uniref:hypothetical protein n=1 Tax=Aliikangiella sp. IMCC44359 TaxID=3459125 RepID=UPI00403B0449